MSVWILVRDTLLFFLGPGLSFWWAWDVGLSVLRSVYFDGVEDFLLALELIYEALMWPDA